jgi:poly(3-hydroxybutyrate) depolymerase
MRLHMRTCCRVAALCLALNSAGWAAGIGDFVARTYNDGKGHALPYRLFIPAGYDSSKKYPLILYFHGAGGRGADNLRQVTDVPRFLVFAEPALQRQWPCFILAPQCPENVQWANMSWSEPTGVGKFTSITWPMEASLALLDSLPQEYRGIDTSRIYVMGISMGGYGTWDAVCRFPRKFKAAVPVCGGGDPTQVATMTDLKSLRVRAYHSADDTTVPAARSREMIQALKALNGLQPKYTEFPDGGHDAYTRAFSDPTLPRWLFESTQSKLEDAGEEFAQQWDVFETSFETTRHYANPFADVEVTVVFQQGDKQWMVPAFWAGGGGWTVRFAPPMRGTYKYRVECSDQTNPDLNGNERTLTVTAYRGNNTLLSHGFIRVSSNRRHFEHADGTPFLWLGDTWWKCLAKRMSWEGFQELTSDRRAKGFSVVQIVCGPYPDEGFFEPRWENEGGKPYVTRDFTTVNPVYFDYADRRLKHLVEAGIVPAIVGAWGRSDCNSMAAIGPAGLKRHWRHLVARYGAYPVVWILAGEIEGGTKWGEGPWAEIARYLRSIDPYHRPLTCHSGGGRRGLSGDELLIDYDMVGGSHGPESVLTTNTLAILTEAYAKKPPMPVLCGETGYEGHMQNHFQYVQRHVFWMYLLSGAAGHTYGAAGVWHASVEGDPGITPVYDLTTWKEGMNFPGSTQIGLGKKLLELYPWSQFAPHPEWAESDCYSAGIPGEVRFIYQPRRGVYNWNGTVVKRIERDVPYHAFYFNPTDGSRHDAGTFVNTGPARQPFAGHAQPLLLADRFEGTARSAWKDYGTPTRRQNGRLVGGRGMVTLLENVSETNLMASVEARSDAEAGIILRFHDFDHYLVALYTPLLKAIYIHDRKNGGWGDPLGHVAVPEIGPKIHLTAAASGPYAAMVLTTVTKPTTLRPSKWTTSPAEKPASGCSRSATGRNMATSSCPGPNSRR